VPAALNKIETVVMHELMVVVDVGMQLNVTINKCLFVVF